MVIGGSTLISKEANNVKTGFFMSTTSHPENHVTIYMLNLTLFLTAVKQ